MSRSSSDVPVVRDGSEQHAVATAWRPKLTEIVSALASGDFELRRVDLVEPITAKQANQMRSYLQAYGETLVELPEQAWITSASQWMDGYWDILVDLWTRESGPSDLALSVRVREHQSGYYYEIRGLYVP